MRQPSFDRVRTINAGPIVPKALIWGFQGAVGGAGRCVAADDGRGRFSPPRTTAMGHDAERINECEGRQDSLSYKSPSVPCARFLLLIEMIDCERDLAGRLTGIESLLEGQSLFGGYRDWSALHFLIDEREAARLRVRGSTTRLCPGSGGIGARSRHKSINAFD